MATAMALYVAFVAAAAMLASVGLTGAVIVFVIAALVVALRWEIKSLAALHSKHRAARRH